MLVIKLSLSPYFEVKTRSQASPFLIIQSKMILIYTVLQFILAEMVAKKYFKNR